MIVAQEQAEIRSLLEDFKNYVQMRAKLKLREPTLRNYTKHIKILILKHNLPAENPTVEDFREALIQRVGYISAATANTAICAARKFAEFKGLDPDTKEMRKIFQFKRVVPTRRFVREDILVPEDNREHIQPIHSATYFTHDFGGIRKKRLRTYRYILTSNPDSLRHNQISCPLILCNLSSLSPELYKDSMRYVGLFMGR